MKPQPRRWALMSHEFGCSGLCAGDGCPECVRLADHITRAKRTPRGPHRDARLLVLAGRVADVMGVREEAHR